MASNVIFGNTNSGLQIGINSGTVHWVNSYTDPLDKLPIAYGAAFDSYTTNENDNQCLPGTRAKLLEEIKEWVLSPDGKCIFWLHGMAGTGKSTVSRTVANSVRVHGLNVASFFFKRGEKDRGNARAFFATICKQLAVGIPDLSPGIREAILSEPDITAKSLKKQFEKLIFQPLVNLGYKAPGSPVAVVIDALDECEVDTDIRDILQVLPLVQELPIRFRIFLTSRPELPIRLGFAKIAYHQYKDLALHEIPESTTASDISLFLKDRFARIRDVRNVPDEWPTDDEFHRLVTLSVPLFISAATICRFIETKLDPVESLANLLRDQDKLKYATKMEQTYLPILTRLFSSQDIDDDEKNELLQKFRLVIGVIILLAVPFSVKTLSRFLDLEERVITNLLNDFQSVLSLPQDRETPIRISHLSFRDFLVQTKSQFYIDMEQTHKNITIHCFTIMRCQLKNNICNLDSYRTQKSEIDLECIHQHLPQELQYSCRYWAHHLIQSGDSLIGISNAFLFLQEHFLHWVEAMILLDAGAEVLGILSLLRSFVSCHDEDDFLKFLIDAERFFLKNKAIAEIAPLQVYSSGLIFAPEMTVIRRLFQDEIPPGTWQLPKVEKNWNAGLLTVEGVSTALAFSPDNRLLASGTSSEKGIQLWDTSGNLRQTIDGGQLKSLAFSPDSRQLASGFRGSIRIFNVVTGTLHKILSCDASEHVTSLAFSPDGHVLAASVKSIICLWDTERWTTISTLKGQSEWGSCLTFSPDGRWLVSSSWDPIIRVWDTATWATKHTLRRYSRYSYSVAFSLDGRFLACCGDIAQIWDTATWSLSRKLEGLEGGSAFSVTFSVDHRLALGCDNGAIMLWDPVTGTLQQTLRGHSKRVRCLTTSRDGQFLASLCDDHTTRIWDLTRRAPEEDFEGHTDEVQGVQFSPDGKILVSTSKKSIRLWDAATGALQQIIPDGPSLIELIVFSPDSRLVACSFYNSGDGRQFIWVWEISTKTLKQKFEYAKHYVRSITFSPDNLFLACGVFKGVEIFDITARAETKAIITGHRSSVEPVLFSPDCRLLASGCGSNDHTVRLWDTTTWKLLYVFDDYAASTCTMSFSPNSRLLAFSTLECSIKLWDTASGVLCQTLTGHESPATQVTFSPNGLLLASCGKDRTIRVWDPVTGALNQRLEIREVATSLQFSLDGRFLTFELGSFDIKAGNQSNCDREGSVSVNEDYRIEFDGHQWIYTRGGGAVWLPPAYRPSYSAINGDTLALGYPSGRVLFFSFLTE
ncbi:hypothetical protein BP00DRAFT_407555 [Aspergillus indologenus CBS 114.80]|uniref:NACHT domain-containing protein n=1 Tax=Aspergillus indologenus CBS 114.80 TaxID=1450541 RepID=A0A2V5HPE5_9EURO|nr:hypothetical protein BP00DRAFT_407555 [Aspergillus indologenus CBS 114.80]